MEARIEVRYPLQGPVEAFLVSGGRVWTAVARGPQVLLAAADAADAAVPPQPLRAIPAASGGMAWDGERLLVADAGSRTVARVDPVSGGTEPLLDVKALDFAGFPAALGADNAAIADIAWSQGSLWIACLAGYSSSVYQIDPQRRAVLRHWWSPGPKPVGLDVAPAMQLPVLIEARSRQLRSLQVRGDWSALGLPAAIGRPQGLTLDGPDRFWTRDLGSGDLCRVAIEGGEQDG